jgi:hypothetical protein
MDSGTSVTRERRPSPKTEHHKGRETRLVPRSPELETILRASRETELMHEHPIHVVTAWLGNSPQIATKHSCG